MKKTYVIEEKNEWEGENFGYIMDLTEEEYNIISNAFKNSNSFSIQECSLTYEEVKKINRAVKNGYKDRYNFYIFEKDFIADAKEAFSDIENDSEVSNPEEEKSEWVENQFYKGSSLIKKGAKES